MDAPEVEKPKKLPVRGKRKNELAYPENPFWHKTEVTLGRKHITVGGGRYVTNEGDSVEHSGVHVIREVDESEFVKIYTRNIRAIFDLKPAAQRVLQYLIVELQKTPNADAVYLAWIGAEEYFSENNVKMSRASFFNAMKELISKRFLAESTRQNMFWFNPNLFFNGNRMTFINEYRKKGFTENMEESGKLSEEQLDWVEQA